MPTRQGGMLAKRSWTWPRYHFRRSTMAPRIVAHDVERVLANIDACHGDYAIELLGHGVLLVLRVPLPASLTSHDPEGQTRIKTIRDTLEGLGWIEGPNFKIDVHWSGGDTKDLRSKAADFAADAPDVILGAGNSSIAVLLQATHSVPVV